MIRGGKNTSRMGIADYAFAWSNGFASACNCMERHGDAARCLGLESVGQLSYMVKIYIP